MPTPFTLTAHYYQQFDADLARDVPGEAYGGWKQTQLTFDRDHTALVAMHAWDCGTPEEFPGWYRCVEYIPRANRIAATVFPPLLAAARQTGFRVYHVISGEESEKAMPGHQRAVNLAKPTAAAPRVAVGDPLMDRVRRWRHEHVFVGKHNQGDVDRGFAGLHLLKEARPVGEEGIAANADQLGALCQADGINHLVYIGFAINWCLLLSPGGMHDMSARGVMCSTIRQAVTAVENAETAREELAKQVALWRVALAFGFVFDDIEFIRAVGGT